MAGTVTPASDLGCPAHREGPIGMEPSDHSTSACSHLEHQEGGTADEPGDSAGLHAAPPPAVSAARAVAGQIENDGQTNPDPIESVDATRCDDDVHECRPRRQQESDKRNPERREGDV